MSAIPTAAQIRLNAVDLLQTASDPSAGGGVAAAIGSFFLRSGTGQAWLKTGAGNTAWSRLQQSFEWNSVKDFGALGDNATDDTAAIQAAIDNKATAGGGVVFFPAGTYRVTQLTINAQDNVQLLGTGANSVLRWTFNAAAAAGSMLTVKSGADHTRISLLTFDGSGLTNPHAGRLNHLLAIGTGAGGAVTECQIFNCKFTGMIAASGDGVHVLGAAGNLVSRLWIADNYFDGCSRFGIGVEQGWQFGWIVDNYLTNCETDIAFVSTADVNTDAILLHGNQIVHTGAVRHALRLEGSATTFITKLIVAQNCIVGGFVTNSLTKYSVIDGNVVTSGAFASTDPVWRCFDNVQYQTFCGNFIDRDSGASLGVCLTYEKSGGTPIYFRIGSNLLLNEKVGGGFLKVVDCTRWSAGGNLLRATDADVSNMFGIDVQAVTVALTDILVGPGNQLTAGAHSMKACVRLLANGANVTDVSVVGNQGDNTDNGLQCEVGGGGGTFNGQLLYGGNNFDSTVGDVNLVGGAAPTVRIGFNASTFGCNLIQGTGDPNGVVTARVGSMFLRTDGGIATAVYYKESGTGSSNWVPLGGSVIMFGTADTTAGAGAVYLAYGWIAAASATEIKFAATRAGTIRNLRVQVATAGTGAATDTFTLRKNGADTTLTVGISNTTTGLTSDVTHTVTVAAADLLSMSVAKSAGVVAGLQNVTASMELL